MEPVVLHSIKFNLCLCELWFGVAKVGSSDFFHGLWLSLNHESPPASVLFLGLFVFLFWVFFLCPNFDEFPETSTTGNLQDQKVEVTKSK